ncbi:MAG: Mpo1-like protein [Thermoanaerobaculia bacterium]
MKRIDELLGDYASHHRTAGNVACHFVGIPLIVYGIVALLRQVRIAEVPGVGLLTAAEVLILVAFLYYVTLDVALAVAMLVFTGALDAMARWADSWPLAVGAFVVGWIFQGVGHAVYEKRSPAFLKNLVHLMVGPLFVLNEALHLRAVEPVKS